jgi:hypothetical protein
MPKLKHHLERHIWFPSRGHIDALFADMLSDQVEDQVWEIYERLRPAVRHLHNQIEVEA